MFLEYIKNKQTNQATNLMLTYKFSKIIFKYQTQQHKIKNNNKTKSKNQLK